MTSEAPLGELLYLPEKVKWCQSQRLFGLRANRDVCLPSVLYGWLSTLECKAELDARSSGTTVMGIRQSELRAVPVLLPKMSVQQKYGQIVGPILLQLWHNESECESLAALRDTLLPKLLSGEVKVRQAERMLEKA
jgi:type I restriction enzyme S subunit